MAEEELKKLIVRIELGHTEDGKAVVEMYEENPRLKYPSLRLFELSQLFSVGIDPNELEQGEERYTRFFAYYTESERLNGQGNPYLDIVRLEAIPGPQSRAQQTLDAMLAALRQIDQRLAVACGLLEVLAEGEDLEPEPKSPAQQETHSPAQQETHSPAQQETHSPAQQETPPVLNEDQARRKFGRLAGPAIRAGSIPSDLPGQLTADVAAGAKGWRDALVELEAAIGSPA
jgi:hypothetical protein